MFEFEQNSYYLGLIFSGPQGPVGKKKESRQRGLNSRPFAYEATALPLSYTGGVADQPTLSPYDAPIRAVNAPLYSVNPAGDKLAILAENFLFKITEQQLLIDY